MSPQSSAVLAATPDYPVAEPKTSGFAEFGLPPKLMQSLARMNFTTPTPVQAAAIPLALAGRDILGSAQTGTGKTGAFGIPLVANLMAHDSSMALIMTPTRELAAQVAAMIQQMIPVQNIKCALLIGGEAMPKQFRQLQANPRIIIGTPGRINDHLRRSSLKLNNASFLVLDETDRMLDMGFGPQIDEIMKFMPPKENGARQTMLFSATLPANIVKLAQKYLNKPERISVGSMTSPITKIKQETLKLGDTEKYEQLMAELEQRTGSVIIFVKTKHGADRLARKLSGDEHGADAIHGDLQQRRRDRVIAEFRDKKFRVLVATDVAARGLDIPHIEHVINYDLPQVPEDYIHRIGRTARAGAEGSAVNFVTPAEANKWRAIHKLIFGHAEEGDRGPSNDRGSKGRGSSGRGSTKPFGKAFSAARSSEGGARGERSYAKARPFGQHRTDERKTYEGKPHESKSAPQWDRGDRGDRSASSGQTDKPRGPWGGDRSETRSSADRPSRPAGGGYADRFAGARTDRPADRVNRPVGRTERPAFRSEGGPGRSERPAADRSARPAERGYRSAERSDRPSYAPRTEGAAGRSERPAGGRTDRSVERSSRPAGDRSSARPAGRTDRPSRPGQGFGKEKSASKR